MQRPTPRKRHDLYSTVHMGLRACMANALVQVGRLDADDESDVRSALSDVRELTMLCAAHLHHEDAYMHPALERRAPGSSLRTGDDHRHHEASIDKLEALANAVERMRGPARAEAQRQLYRALSVFVEENLEHMRYEETANNQVLWEVYTDEELQEIEHALVGAIGPEEMSAFLRWMILAVPPCERAEMLSGMRADAPREVFEAALGIAERALSCTDFEKLSRALGAAA